MQTDMMDRPVAVEKTGLAHQDERPRVVSFETECRGVRSMVARARSGHEIRLAGSDGPVRRVLWSGPLLADEVQAGDRIEVSGPVDARGDVHATRILNLTQGTILRPLPRSLRAAVTGGLVAAGAFLAVVLAGALATLLL